MKNETLRLEQKQTRQTSELKAKNEAIVKELDQVYVSWTLLTCFMPCDVLNHSTLHGAPRCALGHYNKLAMLCPLVVIVKHCRDVYQHLQLV